MRVCDICGDVGYEEMLALCTMCKERSEHVYCMQAFNTAASENWLCEGCTISQRLKKLNRTKGAAGLRLTINCSSRSDKRESQIGSTLVEDVNRSATSGAALPLRKKSLADRVLEPCIKNCVFEKETAVPLLKAEGHNLSERVITASDSTSLKPGKIAADLRENSLIVQEPESPKLVREERECNEGVMKYSVTDRECVSPRKETSKSLEIEKGAAASSQCSSKSVKLEDNSIPLQKKKSLKENMPCSNNSVEMLDSTEKLVLGRKDRSESKNISTCFRRSDSPNEAESSLTDRVPKRPRLEYSYSCTNPSSEQSGKTVLKNKSFQARTSSASRFISERPNPQLHSKPQLSSTVAVCASDHSKSPTKRFEEHLSSFPLPSRPSDIGVSREVTRKPVEKMGCNKNLNLTPDCIPSGSFVGPNPPLEASGTEATLNVSKDVKSGNPSMPTTNVLEVGSDAFPGSKLLEAVTFPDKEKDVSTGLNKTGLPQCSQQEGRPLQNPKSEASEIRSNSSLSVAKELSNTFNVYSKPSTSQDKEEDKGSHQNLSTVGRFCSMRGLKRSTSRVEGPRVISPLNSPGLVNSSVHAAQDYEKISKPFHLLHASMLAEPQSMPESDALWSGDIEVIAQGRSSKCYYDIQAFPSCIADPKVKECTKTLPKCIQATALIRGMDNNSWPKAFQNKHPTVDTVGIFFFPDSRGRRHFYDNLVDRISACDLALSVCLDHAELLIFSSFVFPESDRSGWREKPFLWGVFRGRKPSVPLRNIEATKPDSVEISAELSDMDVDMEGGKELQTPERFVGKVHLSLPPLPIGSIGKVDITSLPLPAGSSSKANLPLLPPSIGSPLPLPLPPPSPFQQLITSSPVKSADIKSASPESPNPFESKLNDKNTNSVGKPCLVGISLPLPPPPPLPPHPFVPICVSGIEEPQKCTRGEVKESPADRGGFIPLKGNNNGNLFQTEIPEVRGLDHPASVKGTGFDSKDSKLPTSSPPQSEGGALEMVERTNSMQLSIDDSNKLSAMGGSSVEEQDCSADCPLLPPPVASDVVGGFVKTTSGVISNLGSAFSSVRLPSEQGGNLLIPSSSSRHESIKGKIDPNPYEKNLKDFQFSEMRALSSAAHQEGSSLNSPKDTKKDLQFFDLNCAAESEMLPAVLDVVREADNSVSGIHTGLGSVLNSVKLPLNGLSEQGVEHVTELLAASYSSYEHLQNPSSPSRSESIKRKMKIIAYEKDMKDSQSAQQEGLLPGSPKDANKDYHCLDLNLAAESGNDEEFPAMPAKEVEAPACSYAKVDNGKQTGAVNVLSETQQVQNAASYRSLRRDIPEQGCGPQSSSLSIGCGSCKQSDLSTRHKRRIHLFSRQTSKRDNVFERRQKRKARTMKGKFKDENKMYRRRRKRASRRRLRKNYERFEFEYLKKTAQKRQKKSDNNVHAESTSASSSLGNSWNESSYSGYLSSPRFKECRRSLGGDFSRSSEFRDQNCPQLDLNSLPTSSDSSGGFSPSRRRKPGRLIQPFIPRSPPVIPSVKIRQKKHSHIASGTFQGFSGSEKGGNDTLELFPDGTPRTELGFFSGNRELVVNTNDIAGDFHVQRYEHGLHALPLLKQLDYCKEKGSELGFADNPSVNENLTALSLAFPQQKHMQKGQLRFEDDETFPCKDIDVSLTLSLCQ